MYMFGMCKDCMNYKTILQLTQAMANTKDKNSELLNS